MRYLHIYLSALATLSPYPSLAIRNTASQLRDLFAYPKYEIQFLNHLPLTRSDAERCHSLGIQREDEFLDLRLSALDRKRVGDGTEGEDEGERGIERLDLVSMNLTPPGAEGMSRFLCLMPSKNSTDNQVLVEEDEEVQDELDPVAGLDALSHLNGRCLYMRQGGWFTYS
jgi:protein OS-9